MHLLAFEIHVTMCESILRNSATFSYLNLFSKILSLSMLHLCLLQFSSLMLHAACPQHLTHITCISTFSIILQIFPNIIFLWNSVIPNVACLINVLAQLMMLLFAFQLFNTHTYVYIYKYYIIYIYIHFFFLLNFTEFTKSKYILWNQVILNVAYIFVKCLTHITNFTFYKYILQNSVIHNVAFTFIEYFGQLIMFLVAFQL